jgi:CBS domain containing-hemolysin-like protein
MQNVLLIILAFLLVLMNAFFVAAEFGMVKLRHTRVTAIKEEYGMRGQILAQVHQQLDAYLSACQLGITLASLGLGWIGEPAFAALLEPVFVALGVHSVELIKFISFAIAFSLISFLHIVIGELMPKSIAIRQAEKVSLWTAIPLYGFYWAMYPIIWLFNTCSNLLLKLCRLDAGHHSDSFYSTDEIKFILAASHIHGELTKDETEIIEHTLEFADLLVTEVMRPKQDMIAIDINEPLEQQLKIILSKRFSRYPIYNEEIDHVIGIVHVKDLFAVLGKKEEITELKSLMRPILKVSTKLPAIELLRKFREGMPHFALVYSDREHLVGFVTLDNLLHVLIGRIKDEFHRTADDWSKNADGSFTVKGECSIFALEQALDKDFDEVEEEEADTVGGLILNRLGYLPKAGEKVEFTYFTATVEKVKGTKIQQIKVWPILKE